jgi:hypothetical protein
MEEHKLLIVAMAEQCRDLITKSGDTQLDLLPTLRRFSSTGAALPNAKEGNQKTGSCKSESHGCSIHESETPLLHSRLHSRYQWFRFTVMSGTLLNGVLPFLKRFPCS